MTSQTEEIARQRTKVQQLAQQVHRAKVSLDEALWGPGGLPTDPQALSRTLANIRRARGPSDVSEGINDACLRDNTYRTLRAQWMLANVELKAMLSLAAVPEAVKATRQQLENRLQTKVMNVQRRQQLGGERVQLENDKDLMASCDEALRDALRRAKTERSLAAVAALGETVAVVQFFGFDGARPEACARAIEEAAAIVKGIAAEAQRKARANPNSRQLQEAAVKIKVLSQLLGND